MGGLTRVHATSEGSLRGSAMGLLLNSGQASGLESEMRQSCVPAPLAKDLGRTFESRAKANLERRAAGVIGRWRGKAMNWRA
jgi:hypothetical protein